MLEVYIQIITNSKRINLNVHLFLNDDFKFLFVDYSLKAPIPKLTPKLRKVFIKTVSIFTGIRSHLVTDHYHVQQGSRSYTNKSICIHIVEVHIRPVTVI